MTRSILSQLSPLCSRRESRIPTVPDGSVFTFPHSERYEQELPIPVSIGFEIAPIVAVSIYPRAGTHSSSFTRFPFTFSYYQIFIVF